MKTKQKLGFGAVLSVCGGIGIILGPAFGITNLGEPWSFICGFAIGVIGGVGAALAIFGLIENRKLSHHKTN